MLIDTATLLENGSVLLTGYLPGAFCSSAAAELYDPRTSRFTGTGPRSLCDVISTATRLLDGRVLFVEGNDSNFPDDVEVYDPVTGTFAHLGWTSNVHEYSAAMRLLDGTVLITGGQVAGGNGNPSVERYLPATGKFVSSMMTTGRHSHTVTLLPDGSVLIAGGYEIWPVPTSSAEVYTP